MKDSEAEELDVLPLNVYSILSISPAAAPRSPHVSVRMSTCQQQHLYISCLLTCLFMSLFLVDLCDLFYLVLSVDISDSAQNIFCPLSKMFTQHFFQVGHHAFTGSPLERPKPSFWTCRTSMSSRWRCTILILDSFLQLKPDSLYTRWLCDWVVNISFTICHQIIYTLHTSSTYLNSSPLWKKGASRK